MHEQIQLYWLILETYRLRKKSGISSISRDEIVAHAVLSGLAHHWPTLTPTGTLDLLEETLEIKTTEITRWMTQRRIAIAKLSHRVKAQALD